MADNEVPGYKILSIDELKKFPGLEYMTDDVAQCAINDLVVLSLILLGI